MQNNTINDILLFTVIITTLYSIKCQKIIIFWYTVKDAESPSMETKINKGK